MHKISYLLIGDDSAVAGTRTKKDCLLTGLWSWSRAVERYGDKGNVKLLRRQEDIEDICDVCHINLTGGNFGLLEYAGELLKNSSTKLMANIDFTISNWDAFPYSTMLKTVFKHVDIPFHTEPVGAKALSHLLGGRQVWTLPHPCDIECLDKSKKEDREPYIATFHHRYHPMVNVLWLAQTEVPLYRVLIGYAKGNVPTLSLFDHVYSHIPFMEAMDVLSRAKFALDLFPFPVHGRAVIDAAALAVPTVCSSQIESCRRCFPELCIDPWDVKKANELFNELIKDNEKYIEVFKNAYLKAEYYGYKACYNRLVQALEEVKEKKK